MRTRDVSCLVLLALSAAALPARAQEWPRFRGPQGAGVTDVKGIPLEWSADKNIAWKYDLPGAGASSPVLWKGRIYLTWYGGVDRWESSQDFAGFNVGLICIRARDGALLWQRHLPHADTQLRGGTGGTRWHGWATATPVVDELGVYVSFGYNGLRAFTHEGEPRWEANPGDQRNAWGYGASPIVVGDLLVVNASCEAGALQAYRRDNGELAWSTPVNTHSWSTPIVVDVDGEPQVVVNVRGAIAGFNPATGERIWQRPGARDYQSTSPIAHDGVVYYSLRNTHRGVLTQALKLVKGGAPEQLWSRDDVGAVVGSPVWHEGRLYLSQVDARTPPNQRGFYCLDAATGETLFHGRPDPMPETVYASPLLAEGRVYFTALRAGTYVLDAGAEYRMLAHNTIEGDEGYVTASPVPLPGGRLLLRSDATLYCIGAE